MDLGTISFRYAKALFSLAEEQKAVDKVYDDLVLLKKIINEEDRCRAILKMPALTGNRKATIITSLFKEHISDLTLRFLLYTVEKHREAYLALIILKYFEFYQEQNNIIPVHITTAESLTADEIKEFKTVLKKQFDKTPDITFTVDATLIGGYILTLKDKRIDMSISSALKKFSKTA